MALTKVGRGLLNTSIVDNGNATAITIDSSENVSFTGAATFSALVSKEGTSGAASASGSANNLILENSGNAGLTIATPATGIASIFFSDPGSNAAGYLQYNHNTDALSLFSSGTVSVTGAATFSGDVDVDGVFSVTDAGSAFVTREDGGGFSYTQGLDVATAGCTFIGASSRGDMASISLYQTATGVDGGYIKFNTSSSGSTTPTEKMRLDSNGNLGLNTTPTTAKIKVVQSAGDWIFETSSNAASPYGIYVGYTGAAPNNAGSYFYYGTDYAAARFQVRSNGGIANYQSNNVNLSDEREKNQFGAIGSQSECVRHWEVVEFLYKDEDQTNPHKYGVIAQQVAEHCPEVISNWVKVQGADEVLWAEEDELPEGVSVGDVKTEAVEQVDRIGVKEQQMFWMLVKSHQEALDTIDALTARLEALEGA